MKHREPLLLLTVQIYFSPTLRKENNNHPVCKRLPFQRAVWKTNSTTTLSNQTDFFLPLLHWWKEAVFLEAAVASFKRVGFHKKDDNGKNKKRSGIKKMRMVRRREDGRKWEERERKRRKTPYEIIKRNKWRKSNKWRSSEETEGNLAKKTGKNRCLMMISRLNNVWE